MKITYQDIKKNEEIRAYIKKGNANLACAPLYYCGEGEASIAICRELLYDKPIDNYGITPKTVFIRNNAE